MPDIPIIGQPFSVLCWYPTTLVQCQCRKEQLTLIVVTGVGVPAACGACGKHYWIQGFKPGAQGLEVLVQMGVPAQKPATEIVN